MFFGCRPANWLRNVPKEGSLETKFFMCFFAVVVVLLAFVCLFVLCRLVVIQILCVLGSDTEKWCRRGSCVSTSTVVTTPERRRGVLV